MRKYLSKKNCSIIVVSLVLLALTVGGALVYLFKSKANDKEVTAKERLQACREEVHAALYGKDTEVSEVNLDEKVRAIITLEEEAVADNNKISDYTSKLKSKENKIIKEQKDIVKEVEQLTGNKVINQTGYLVNSFSIDATRREMKKIAKIDGVKNVKEAVTYKPYMETAVEEGNVKAQIESQEYGYTGEGVVIAVIDSGVNYEHQDMALDTGVKTKFSKEEWKEKIDLLGYGKYMSNKVPFGYNYVTGENSCSNSAGEHGYHVSSIAAANGKINGVAKNAQVLGLNIFGKQGYATSDDIVAAIEDAVKLGADIINLSLGCDIPIVSDDYEQEAIDKASKEGVICCVAAGNAATSSSDSGPKNLLNLKDTAMVGSLAVTDASIAVASAENIRDDYGDNQDLSRENADIKMSQFSSWGPTNELGIKPEITAPGGNIKAACQYEDEYKVFSGTSMASPFIAGSQAVMLNAIKARGLDLKGEELVKFMKNSLMNTADVIIDKSSNNPYSVRYQGAGLVDVYGAVDNNVIVICNGEAKVELGDFVETKTFELTIKNYGKETCTYRLNNTQIYKDSTDDTRWRYGISPVENASITYSMNNIVVEPEASVNVTATVNIPDNYENNSYVEAFIQLEGQDTQNIGLPVLGFYGDWDSEPIIDKTLYDEEKSVINSNLLYEKNKIGSYIALINEESVEKAGLGVKKVQQDLSELQKDSEPIEAVPSTNFDMVALEENVECDIKYDGFIAEFSVKVKEDGYYTFKLDDIPLSEITLKQAYDKKYGEHDNIFEIKGMGNLSKETALLTGREYRFKLHILKSGMMHLKQGKIRFYKSSGENAYITENVYDKELSAFSPNTDNVNDKIAPSLVVLRCAKEAKVNILDSNRNVIRTIGNVKDIAKTTFRLDGYAYDGLVGRPHESLLYNNNDNTSVAWDGKIYNTQSGEFEYAKEGLYYVQIIAKRAEDALPYVMDMPIRIDNVKPQVKEFNVSKVEGDTIVEFNVNDNHSLKGNFYIDIEEKTEKGVITYTYEKKYLETNISDKGNYVLNLGDIDISKITLLVEDMAGNQVYESIVEESNEDITNIDSDLEYELENNLCEGVDINTSFNEDAYYSIEEGKVKFYGACMKDVIININGVEASYFEDLNSDVRRYEIEVPVVDGKETMELEVVVNKSGEEIFRRTYNIKIDVNPIEVNMVEGSYVLKSSPYCVLEMGSVRKDKQEEVILVEKQATGRYGFEFKVNGKPLKDIEEIIYVTAQKEDESAYSSTTSVPVKVKYENKDTFFVEMEDIESDVSILVEWETNSSDYCAKRFNVTTSKIKYTEMCDSNVVKIASNIEGISIIDNTMVNSDGTFLIEGKIHKMPEKLTINETEVKVNLETLEFSYNIPIKKGLNYIGIEATIDGISYYRGNKVNYEEITVSLDESIKDVDGVITSDSDIFNLKGTIKSYSSVSMIEINGDKLYSASDYIMSTEGKAIEKKFDYVIKLDKGINKIKFVVKTGSLKTEEKIITVDYK